ncbi:HYR domain-containing protein [Myxococcus sp. CA033]|uniref:HYR domain-containing protein n=1 Tax=Myxococcus sp. CA033 TaxID=2741516 RepID=UPI00157A9955|nr:HYR domain-containing protein [Myxococcus sp. CA033]
MVARAKASAAEPPFLVRDLLETDAPYYTGTYQFTAMGNHVFFTNATPGTGRELWKSDGTAKGTALVQDLLPGAGVSGPSYLTELGGWLYFTSGTWDSNGLWRTRGTPESTEFVHAMGDGPRFIARMGDALYFIAQGGLESPRVSSLWRSDGTPAGTLPLTAVRNPSSNSGAKWVQVNGTLFFAGEDTVHGEQLWKTDGTLEGTGLVKDVFRGTDFSGLADFVAVNDLALFWARDTLNVPDQLWRSDGTTEGTVRVQSYPRGSSRTTPLTVVGEVAYFQAVSTLYGQELWRTDGTDSGTYRLNLVPVVANQRSPNLLTAFSGQLFFMAMNEQAEWMLWRSDGTEQGSRPVTSVIYDAESAVGSYGPMLATPDGLYFFAGQPGMSHELWKSDGTAAGTVRLTEGLGLTRDLDKLHLWKDGTLYFSTRGGELWTSDGTSEGTRVLLRKTGATASSNPREAVNLKGRLFFVTDGAGYGRDLWMSDGTREGTEPLTDLRPGADGGQPFHLMAARSQLYFIESSSTGDYRIWRTDGTRPGTHAVGSLPLSRFASFDKGRMAVIGEELFFFRRSGNEDELWKTDGTPDGTVFLKRSPGITFGWDPQQFTPARGRLFFVADTHRIREALWVSDGTPDGTRMVVNISALAHSRGSINRVVPVGDEVFLFASIEGEGATLWKSDGTEKGTVRVAVGVSPPEGNNTAVIDGTLYFINKRYLADTGTSATELWRSNGLTAVKVKDLSAPTPYAGRPAPDVLTAFRGAVYFWAYDAAHGYELWKSDGTEAGTRMLTELNPGLMGAVLEPGPLVALGPDGPLMFSASDGVSGMELWQTDGTAEGTVPAADLVPGHDSSSPKGLTVAGRHLFFSAYQKDTGVELWALPRTVADTTPPEVVCPAHPFVEATSPQGARVFFTRATATDDTDPFPGLFYSPGWGEAFPMGDSSITVTAADEAGNRSSCRFDLTVRDTQPPALECPGPQRHEAMGPDGTQVWFPRLVASDVASVPVVRTSQPTGTRFPLGTTEVEVTATDGAGLRTTCHFPVEVVDTVAPRVTCPSPMKVEASMPEGAVVAFFPPIVDELVSIPTVVFSPASGSTLPMGWTSVRVTATDAAGNSNACTFSVEVVDTTAPRLTCPPRQRVTQTSESGAIASYPAVDVVDTVSTTRVEFNPPEGRQLPLGTTVVSVSATDTRANSAWCTFQVEVVRAPSQPGNGTPDAGTPDAGPQRPSPGQPTMLPPWESSGCGCAQTNGAPWAFLALMALGVLAPRARRGARR